MEKFGKIISRETRGAGTCGRAGGERSLRNARTSDTALRRFGISPLWGDGRNPTNLVNRPHGNRVASGQRLRLFPLQIQPYNINVSFHVPDVSHGALPLFPGAWPHHVAPVALHIVNKRPHWRPAPPHEKRLYHLPALPALDLHNLARKVHILPRIENKLIHGGTRGNRSPSVCLPARGEEIF